MNPKLTPQELRESQEWKDLKEFREFQAAKEKATQNPQPGDQSHRRPIPMTRAPIAPVFDSSDEEPPHQLSPESTMESLSAIGDTSLSHQSGKFSIPSSNAYTKGALTQHSTADFMRKGQHQNSPAQSHPGLPLQPRRSQGAVGNKTIHKTKQSPMVMQKPFGTASTKASSVKATSEDTQKKAILLGSESRVTLLPDHRFLSVNLAEFPLKELREFLEERNHMQHPCIRANDSVSAIKTKLDKEFKGLVDTFTNEYAWVVLNDNRSTFRIYKGVEETEPSQLLMVYKSKKEAFLVIKDSNYRDNLWEEYLESYGEESTVDREEPAKVKNAVQRTKGGIQTGEMRSSVPHQDKRKVSSSVNHSSPISASIPYSDEEVKPDLTFLDSARHQPTVKGKGRPHYDLNREAEAFFASYNPTTSDSSVEIISPIPGVIKKGEPVASYRSQPSKRSISGSNQPTSPKKPKGRSQVKHRIEISPIGVRSVERKTKTAQKAMAELNILSSPKKSKSGESSTADAEITNEGEDENEEEDEVEARVQPLHPEVVARYEDHVVDGMNCRTIHMPSPVPTPSPPPLTARRSGRTQKSRK
ncbi:uncharacterized protein IL334_006799 [Kwoniella shivajii]|uniref:Uncharacterized protein n=1 Tax=Kwoniella shivajii TaxID=564305 RepID=A0ABZ1D7M2_9TREE|nr:hypothetical protein IL334_006799 [Kwoniella shivajii]